eukprot:1904407-Lingulodinium_polyedra.AAC.1
MGNAIARGIAIALGTVTGSVATELPLSRQARRSACVSVTRKRRAKANIAHLAHAPCVIARVQRIKGTIARGTAES